MVPTQIQLPDELYERAKRFGAERAMTLTELAQKGIELLMEQFPNRPNAQQPWRVPRVQGELKGAPENLRDFAMEDEETRQAFSHRRCKAG